MGVALGAGESFLSVLPIVVFKFLVYFLHIVGLDRGVADLAFSYDVVGRDFVVDRDYVVADGRLWEELYPL